eukprot:CAMPEP_0182581374 /NCGR_PEP_ID=MMETSP1324-20130603/49770_1 /TAXON_ID=236786 /ORGANISM="Florenciella sp., Strain RCC1587" /LENGTH=52 /DNA_ID=CAMNT_0024797725 /DNA_START=222 /DNA_END=376 /DNA_ORIENTATION=-
MSSRAPCSHHCHHLYDDFLPRRLGNHDTAAASAKVAVEIAVRAAAAAAAAAA